MKIRRSLIVFASGLAIAGMVQAQDTTTTIILEEPEVRTIVTSEGYGDPILIERDGDLWRVKSVKSGSDEEVILFVNGEGNILAASEVTELRITQTTPEPENEPAELEVLNESAVAMVVMNAGFHNVHDIDFLDGRGVWKAEADDISGEDYELHVSPETGKIVHIEDD